MQSVIEYSLYLKLEKYAFFHWLLSDGRTVKTLFFTAFTSKVLFEEISLRISVSGYSFSILEKCRQLRRL
jgi:hypothetical protein